MFCLLASTLVSRQKHGARLFAMSTSRHALTYFGLRLHPYVCAYVCVTTPALAWVKLLSPLQHVRGQKAADIDEYIMLSGATRFSDSPRPAHDGRAFGSPTPVQADIADSQKPNSVKNRYRAMKKQKNHPQERVTIPESGIRDRQLDVRAILYYSALYYIIIDCTTMV